MYDLICFLLGRYTLILVYHHIFPSICLFNLSCDITYLGSDSWLLMQTLWCTTLSVHLVTIVDGLSVTTDGRELCQLVRLVLTSRKMVLIVPPPLVPTLLP